MEITLDTKAKLVIVGILIAIIGLVYLFIYLFVPTSVTVTISPGSTVKSNIEFTIDAGSPIQAPATVKVRAGSRIFAFSTPGNSSVNYQRIRIWPMIKYNISGSVGDEELPGLNKFLSNPYIQLFPYKTIDYNIEATQSVDNSTLSKIVITVFHRFSSPSQTTQYASERDLAVTAAKKWLTTNNIPNTIPITVIDQ